MHLLPLASNLETITYNLNDIIIKKGEKPPGLFIILEGHCIVVTEGYSLQCKHGGEYANPRIRK